MAADALLPSLPHVDQIAPGLLYGRLAGWPFERSARFANGVGALATSAVGASEGVHGVAETLAFAGLRQQSWCFVDEVAFIVD